MGDLFLFIFSLNTLNKKIPEGKKGGRERRSEFSEGDHQEKFPPVPYLLSRLSLLCFSSFRPFFLPAPPLSFYSSQ